MAQLGNGQMDANYLIDDMRGKGHHMGKKKGILKRIMDDRDKNEER